VIELDGQDLRRLPIEQRKARLAKLLRGAASSIALNEHFDGDGAIVFRHRRTAPAAPGNAQGQETGGAR
jgi:ATP-dependent DNA ligase